MRAIATLEVNFLAGTKLRDCIEEASRIARQLDLAYVIFTFNETRFSVSQTPDVDDLVSRYSETAYIIDKGERKNGKNERINGNNE